MTNEFSHYLLSCYKPLKLLILNTLSCNIPTSLQKKHVNPRDFKMPSENTANPFTYKKSKSIIENPLI